jgi:cell division protease FtsH
MPGPRDNLPNVQTTLTVLAVLVSLLLFFGLLPALLPAPSTEIPYSQFQSLLASNGVENLVVGPDTISGTLKHPKSGESDQFVTDRVEPALAATLGKNKITFTGQPASGPFAKLLGWLLPILIFGAVFYFVSGGRLGGTSGLLSISKSRARVYAEDDVPIRFSDVAGVDEAKAELEEVVEFLKAPADYGRLGAHIPKGVLLVGPPGTGKTLLARAVAGEAGVPFFSISGSEFVELFVGVGAARVRDLFEQARRRAPAIIFIDELDSLGRARNAAVPSTNDEKEQTLNQLLAEMDGFDPSSGVVLLAATNRPEILDPALLRAGRFDRQVLVDRPDRSGRADILRLHIRKVHLAPDVSLEDVAAMTPGFTGADLANLVNEAALLATRRRADAVTFEDFNQALERIVAGLEKRSRLLAPKERNAIAYHEMGHAITAMALPDVDKVQKISIIPHGIAALGYTIQRPLTDRFLMERGELINRLTVLLGGRAAESLVFSDVSTGAADDLARATEIARSMVVRYGMDEKLGQVAYETELSPLLTSGGVMDYRPRRYSERTAAAIDAAIHDLLDGAYGRARAILKQNSALLRDCAVELLAHESISGSRLNEIEAEVLPAKDETFVPRHEIPTRQTG